MLKKTLMVLMLGALASVANAEVKTIKDVIGREVKVDVPAKRIVLGFYYPDYLAVAGKDGFDNVVGFSKDVWAQWNPKSWEAFSKAVPRLQALEDVGEIEVGTFSVEKILSLKPDLLVLADWQWQVIEPDLEPLEKAGIPVVVLDYNREQVPLHLDSTRVLGEITGQEARAEAVNNFYKGVIDDVKARVEKLGVPKKKMYVEFGNKGPNEFGFTFGKNMWGPLIELAQGENIAAPFVEQWGPINPEQILVAKPDVIVISGRETELKKNDEAMVMGITVTPEEAKKRLAGYEKRPGWSELPALKSGHLHGIYHGASRTQADAASVQYLAKAMYPEAFEDVDPAKTYVDFHKQFLPVVPEGTFFISLP